MFKKSYRLNTSDFNEVFNFGKTIKTKFFLIKKKDSSLKHSRFSVNISKKVVKKAFQRNYFKRRTYNAIKEVYKSFPVADYIFILNSESKDIQYSDIINHLKEIQL